MRNLTAKHIAANIPNSGLWLNTALGVPTVSTAPTIPNFNLATFTLPLSFGYWIKFDNGVPSVAFGKYGMGSNAATGFSHYAAQSANGYYLQLNLRAVVGGVWYGVAFYFSSESLSDGKWHSIVTTIGASGGRVKLYFDGVYGAQSGIHNLTSVPFNGLFSLQSAGNSFAKPFVCNFDMSAISAPYKIADYQNGKDIPTPLLTATSGDRFLLALRNDLTGAVWGDDSAGTNNMTLAGTYNIIDVED